MQLINLVFRERPGYREMSLRPFSADATPELINRLGEDTRGGLDLTPAALSRTAGQIIRPVADVTGRAIITDGQSSWSDKRFMFIMTVMVRESRTTRSTLEISGYTDHVGAIDIIGKGIKLAPEMALYFNSIVELEQAYMNTPSEGDGWRVSVNSANHILTAQTRPDFRRDRLNTGTLSMRPEDVFQSKPQDILQNSFNRRVADEGVYMDMRNAIVPGRPKLSSRLNDSSTRYLHRSLRAMSTANEGLDYGFQEGFQQDQGAVLTDARKQVKERVFSSIPLFSQMARDSRIMDSGFITYGELVDMNPDFNFDDVKVFFLGNNYRDYSTDSSDWDRRDNTGIAAAQIARVLPTYMTLHQIAFIRFEANNHGYGGEPVILITECLPMLGKRVSHRALDSFEQRLITELFVDMLPYDGCLFDIRVEASLSADILIDIAIADETPGDFAFPVFSDSLVAPVIVDDNDIVTGMGSAIIDIADSLGGDDLISDFDREIQLPDRDFNF